MGLHDEYIRNLTRRHFFQQGSHAVGWAALASLLGTGRAGAAGPDVSSPNAGSVTHPAGLPHFPPKAKHVIYPQPDGPL